MDGFQESEKHEAQAESTVTKDIDMLAAHAEFNRVNNLNGLNLLRAPIAENLIGQLPKPTTKQTESLKADSSLGIRCGKCGGWHHKDVAHLDYVGHAAITSRLLAADPYWNWKPVAFGNLAAGELDKFGGMWIELTVCGVTRLGYGDAGGKAESANANKERIGDALRNAAMRFGAALELWHKGELYVAGLDADDAEVKTSNWTPQAIETKPAQKTAPVAAVDTSNGKKQALEATVDKSTGEIVPAGTATIPEAELPPVEQAPAAAKAPVSAQQSPADSAIVSVGEAQFLRNKLNGKVESDVCKQFNVSSETFATATKTQWVDIKKFLTGK